MCLDSFPKRLKIVLAKNRLPLLGSFKMGFYLWPFGQVVPRTTNSGSRV